MNRFLPAITILCVFLAVCAAAPCRAAGREVLRGEVGVAVEPPSGGSVEEQIPPSADELRRQALEEAACYYGGMIYGWSFRYDVGERARRTPEEFSMESLGTVRWGDPALRATGAQFIDNQTRGGTFHLESDFYMDESQRARAAVWRSGGYLSVQGLGSSVLADIIRIGPDETADTPPKTWLDLKKTALKDAARAALRSYLRGRERERPKEVTGFISLASFPRYVNQSGRLSAVARFYIEVKEIVPFAAW